jgi:hypothetical protein
MNSPLIPFEGNCNTSVVRQGKYRVVHHGDNFAVEVIIETPDGIRSYPTSRAHPLLVAMVNLVKLKATGVEGGQFYLNEWHQVVVPAGNPVRYFYAGEYPQPVVLTLDDVEFSGRPHDDTGNLLKPGDAWVGRPRPGIEYVLKAGGTDIEYKFELSPGREKIVRLSRLVGETKARQTARKIALIKGNKGGRFYVNEYRALFGPQQKEDGYSYVFIGILTDEDPWFPKWIPTAAGPVTPSPPSTASAGSPALEPQPALPVVEPDFCPAERKLEIVDGDVGHSMDSLFSAYVRSATKVTVEDPFVVRPHQIANLLRFCELLVRMGTCRKVRLVTKEVTDESRGRLETIKRSLAGYNVEFVYDVSPTLHDRQIVTDTGWEISLGRGLDLYKRPDDWLSVGATDFALRPCYQTTIIFHRLGNQACTTRQA